MSAYDAQNMTELQRKCAKEFIDQLEDEWCKDFMEKLRDEIDLRLSKCSQHKIDD